MAKPARPIEMDDVRKARYDVYLREFTTLKTEQIQRISFRDNMLYVTLAAVGGVASFALKGSAEGLFPGLQLHLSALLMIPWISAVLGWTYVINDEKISAIGEYIKKPGGLADRIHELVGGDRSALFGWERAHTSDDWRFLRKLSQLAVDLTTFVLSGFVAMYVFHRASGAEPHSPEVTTLMYGEGILLTVLAGWIVKYSGVWRGHGKEGAKVPTSQPEPPKSDAG